MGLGQVITIHRFFEGVFGYTVAVEKESPRDWGGNLSCMGSGKRISVSLNRHFKIFQTA